MKSVHKLLQNGPKRIKKWSKMPPRGTPGPVFGHPGGTRGVKHRFLTHFGAHLGCNWEPLGHKNRLKSAKRHDQKPSWCAPSKKSKKYRTLKPPEPSISSYRCSGSTVHTFAAWSKKSSKMTPKVPLFSTIWCQNDQKVPPRKVQNASKKSTRILSIFRGPLGGVTL